MSQEPETAVDFAYLEGFAAGDMKVVTEVLALFREQAQVWLARLSEPGPDLEDVAHTIKGAARGIGAGPLAAAAARVEQGGAPGLPELRAALAEADAEIEGYLTRFGGG